jgi:hypothetical protein
LSSRATSTLTINEKSFSVMSNVSRLFLNSIG